MTDRDSRTDRSQLSQAGRPLLEQFQLLGDGIEAMVSRLTVAPSPS